MIIKKSLSEFVPDKKYIFSTDIFLLLHNNQFILASGITEPHLLKTWVDMCDGKEVFFICADLGGVGEYRVNPHWCYELN